MLEIRNKTPFNASLIPSLDKHGQNYAVIIIKGTFDIHSRAAALVIIDEQQPLQQNDVFYGEPGISSIQYEADVAPIKQAVDIVLNGHAYATAGHQVSAIEASLQIGQHKKTVRVIGDRTWQKDNLLWRQTSPEKFARMPLVYENAFGGVAQIANDQTAMEFCAYNPVGKGFVGTKGQGMKEGLALPNIEDPAHLIQYWDDCPIPVGFGFIGRNWQPRLAYAGIYDKQWQQERMPLLPMSFDDRYNNGAHAHLVLPGAIAGGEEVIATNLSESGHLKFTLPRYRFMARAMIKGKTVAYAPIMDTVVIEPDAMRVLITWRVAIPCANQFLYIDNVTLDWKPV